MMMVFFFLILREKEIGPRVKAGERILVSGDLNLTYREKVLVFTAEKKEKKF